MKNDKTTINLSTTTDTKERIKELAAEQHCTVSQLVTRWVWDAKLESEKKVDAND